MTTFSQLVDTIMSESRRPDLQTEIATYINQTVRELHFDSEQNKILYFNDNMREVQLRSEEHTSELQSLMRNSYAVFCLKKKKKIFFFILLSQHNIICNSDLNTTTDINSKLISYITIL